jgi:hypothetical protein
MQVIWVDIKKKELPGNYDHGGKQWLPAKKPVKVNGHDFPSPDVPGAHLYCICDLGRDTGFVNAGTDHGTGAFAGTPFSLNALAWLLFLFIGAT